MGILGAIASIGSSVVDGVCGKGTTSAIGKAVSNIGQSVSKTHQSSPSPGGKVAGAGGEAQVSKDQNKSGNLINRIGGKVGGAAAGGLLGTALAGPIGTVLGSGAGATLGGIAGKLFGDSKNHQSDGAEKADETARKMQEQMNQKVQSEASEGAGENTPAFEAWKALYSGQSSQGTGGGAISSEDVAAAGNNPNSTAANNAVSGIDPVSGVTYHNDYSYGNSLINTQKELLAGTQSGNYTLSSSAGSISAHEAAVGATAMNNLFYSDAAQAQQAHYEKIGATAMNNLFGPGSDGLITSSASPVGSLNNYMGTTY